ncbi:HNH endonuclease [Pseudomonas sp. v388]|uniref:HNH endonuclease n=1 Tax=Pseudomonas sp. v388 TaxID=2479849 RepID=UPI000F79C3CC|nr:hypothetical protein [Pseudomonas sp. v388]
MGEVTALVISTIATGGGGSASQSMQMAKMGIVMSSKDLARVAATVKLSDVKERIAGIVKVGRDLDVPVVEPVATPGAAAAGAKATEQASLPSYYREDSSAGAQLVRPESLPDGYRLVLNTRTGNREALSPEGVFYRILPDGGGLKPKAGGNLAQLVKAEQEIAGAKATPSGSVSGETGVVGTGKAAANDASFTPTSTSGWTSISSDARAVVRDVENHSGVPMPSTQRTQLAEELRQVDHTYVASRSDYQALQREYNSQRNNLKREWELNTGLTWPKTESGVDFQAHHVIPQQYGGPNQWWNLHPVPVGSAHQGGVHAPASPTTTAFPQNPPRRP